MIATAPAIPQQRQQPRPQQRPPEQQDVPLWLREARVRNVAELRRVAGLTRRELAAWTGLPLATIRLLERPGGVIARQPIVARLCLALMVTSSAMLGEPLAPLDRWWVRLFADNRRAHPEQYGTIEALCPPLATVDPSWVRIVVSDGRRGRPETSAPVR